LGSKQPWSRRFEVGGRDVRRQSGELRVRELLLANGDPLANIWLIEDPVGNCRCYNVWRDPRAQ
jgi:hypothetical protein